MRGQTPLPRLGAASALLLAALSLAGCRATNEHPPDQLLRDSLGLGEEDQVFRVRLSAGANRERADPDEVRVPVGAFVEFVSTDRRVRTIRFDADSLTGPRGDFLRDRRQAASPPLLELDSRFVVSFRDAPPGRYPYIVEGNGEDGRGVVVVEEGAR